ncbi:MAG: hypothetical protein ACJAZ1_002939 [Yoonia sp.]|jgi:hypothetical protein
MNEGASGGRSVTTLAVRAFAKTIQVMVGFIPASVFVSVTNLADLVRRPLIQVNSGLLPWRSIWQGREKEHPK